MELGLAGKVAIVTGGGRGIGSAVATELAREGVNLFLTGRDRTVLDGVSAELSAGGRIRVVTSPADLTEPAAAGRIVAEAVAAFGRIDILVNNAGATKRGNFLELTDADWMDGFGLKLHGYVRMSRAAWPHLRESGGAIVNIVGNGSRAGNREFTIGGAVNAALLNLTKALADLGIEEGVRVNAINPGRIETERLTRNLQRLASLNGTSEKEAAAGLLAECGIRRFGLPEEIGYLATFLASDKAAFIQGSLIDIDGGQVRAL